MRVLLSSLREAPTKADTDELRLRLIDVVERLDGPRTAALALSGGLGSSSLLFAMLATGRRPRCYTWSIEGRRSLDLESARHLTTHFGLELVELEIPIALPNVLADCRDLVHRFDQIDGIAIQISHPWLYIGPAMQARGDSVIMTGLSVDERYLSRREIWLKIAREGEQVILDEELRGWKRQDLDTPIGAITDMAAKRWGIEILDGYGPKQIDDWFMQFKLAGLHKPFDRAPSVLAFADYYGQGKFRRAKNGGQLQIKKLHDLLLTDPEINLHGASKPRAVYTLIRNGDI